MYLWKSIWTLQLNFPKSNLNIRIFLTKIWNVYAFINRNKLHINTWKKHIMILKILWQQNISFQKGISDTDRHDVWFLCMSIEISKKNDL